MRGSSETDSNSPGTLPPAGKDNGPKVTKSGFLQLLRFYLLIRKMDEWGAPSLTRNQPLQSFWGLQKLLLHKECSLSAKIIYNWCDKKELCCTKSASQALFPSLSQPTGAGSFPLFHRHRPGNKAARSSAVDIFSLFSTLLTSITSEAAVSLNENWKDLSHLSPSSAQKKTLHFLKAFMTLCLWVTPTQKKRCDRGSRQRLVMGPSDLNHFSLALQSTVWFFFFTALYLPP